MENSRQLTDEELDQASGGYGYICDGVISAASKPMAGPMIDGQPTMGYSVNGDDGKSYWCLCIGGTLQMGQRVRITQFGPSAGKLQGSYGISGY